MPKAIAAIVLIAGAGLGLMMFPSGCGDQEAAQLPETAPRTVVEEDPLQEKVEELEKIAFTVKITGSRDFAPVPIFGSGFGTDDTYSQDGKGSWRTDNPSGSLIYNAEEKKFWFIQGKTAWEFEEPTAEYPQLPSYMSTNPLARILTMVPARVGPFARPPAIAGVDGVWEWDLSKPAPPSGITVARPETPGGPETTRPEYTVKMKIEFKGPEGLLSRIVMTNPGGTQEQVFEYSNVGDVPEDVFRLPGDIEEVRIFTPSPGSPLPFPFSPGGR